MSIERLDSSVAPVAGGLSTPAEAAPIMEAVHLRKYFPLRQIRLGGPASPAWRFASS